MKRVDKKVSVGMPQELYDKLKEVAVEDCRSVPSCIRLVSRDYVEKMDKKPGPG